MAQQDAMEQVKEVVRQLIKFRFWISVGAAALFGLIAYFVGAGPVRAKADEETKKIKAAETEVKTYRSPLIPTKEYAQLVDEKLPVLTRDVNMAWKTLYDRQAPLLTWPETVQERFRKWGRKWPENEDASRVTLAQVDYIAAYKEYVDMVYKTFNPFDFETGEGIVVAPPKEVLLGPAVFSDEHLPGLGRIWSAQERLWIQRTLLEVVAQVNKNANAKDWNSAIIREIEGIDVGNSNAQDQRSIAKNDQLEEAPKILAPGETDAPAEGGGGMAPTGGSGRGGMMGGRGMAAAANQETQTVYYVKSGNDQQYKVLPVMMTVLIDQDHVQDLLIELENSPMSIQVMDLELQRPGSRVTKPEKGTAPPGGGGGRMGGMGGGIRSNMMRGMGRGMTGFGGMMNQMGAMGQMGMRGGMGRMGGDGMAGGTGAARKGIDNRSKNRADARKKEEEQVSKATGPSLFDPYFDIVQVTVYGQARFFNPPPEIPALEPSPGDTLAAPAANPAAGGGASPDAKGAPAATPAAAAGADTATKPAAPATDGAAPKVEAVAGAGGNSPAPPAGSEPPKPAGAPSAVAPADAKKPEVPPADANKPAAPPADSKGAAPKS
jgi:hypothetical protein